MTTQKLFQLGILLSLICLRSGQAADCLPAPSGQVFWWRLEGNGQDTMKRLDITVPPAAIYETGKVGQGLTFDGLQGVTLGAVPELNRTSFTWEAWVRRADTNRASLASPPDGAIIAGGARSFSLTLGQAGNLFLSHVGVQSYNFGASITDLDWHHVCLLRNGNLFRLYLDGASAGQLEVAGIATESAFAVGSLSASFGGYFYALLGSVDEVAFFSRELEPTEIKALYDAGAAGRCVDIVNLPCTAVPGGLVAWYPLDVGPENLAPGGQPGTAGVESYGPGMVRGAATFDGLNPGIVLPEDPRMRTQEFTVEAWVRRASTTASSQASPADGAVFSGGTRSYAMAIRSDGVLYLSHVGEVSIPSDGRLLDTEWHHVAMAKSGSQMFFYLDGLPVGVRDLGGMVFDLSTPFAIGSLGVPFFGIHYAFLGSVDELGFYDRPLSGAEIFSIWSAADRGKCRGNLGVNLDVPEEVVEGSGFAYAVNVGNQGTNRLDGVVVTNRVPAGFEVRETQPETGTTQITTGETGTEVVWTVGALDAGIARRLWIHLGAGPLGTHRLLTTAVKAGAEPGPVVASETFQVRPECSPVPVGLLSWWRGESNTVDSVSGTPGGVGSGVSYTPGRVGTAFAVNGSQGSGIPLGTPAGFGRPEFSIEGWVRRSDSPAGGRDGDAGTILGADDGGWYFSLRNDGALLFGKTDFIGVISAVAITDRRWHHVGVTRGQGEVRFYADGVLIATHSFAETFAPDREYGLGGLLPSGRNPFPGDLDEIAFYDRVLTAAEIAAVAAAGGAPKCAEDLVLSATPGGPVPVGEDWEMVLTAASMGRVDSTQVVLTAAIPPGLQYQSATASQGTVENLAGVLRASLGTIPAAGSASVRLVLRPLLAGTYLIAGTVQRQETELSTANNRVEITGNAVPLTISVQTPRPVTEPEPVEFAVTLSAPSRGTVRVAYQTEGVTASAGADYETQAGVLEFAPGTVRQVVRVPVAADGIYETDETLRLVLGTPEGAGAGTLLASAVIQSPEPLPLARVAPLILTEGNSGTTPMRFEVHLDRPSGLLARLRFATTNDSAKAPTDYVAAEGMLDLAPGQTNAVIEILLNGDTSEEPNETVVVTFSDLEGLRMPTTSVGGAPVPAIGTIVNDDAVPGVARGFSWDAVPADATTGVPFPARLTARDGIGEVAGAFNGAVGVRGYAGPGAPSSVILTEIAVGSLQGVELQNVSPNPVDISGWQIHLYDTTRWPAPRIVFVIPSATVLDPAAVVSVEMVLNQFQVPGAFPRFRVLGRLVWPRPNPQVIGSDLPVGAVVTDAAGVVADTFFTGGADPKQIGVPRLLTDDDWSGPAVQPVVTGVQAPTSFVRPAGQRRNTRSAGDWAGAATQFTGFGTPNPGLVLPFEDAVPLPVAPDAVSGFVSGAWTGDLTLNGYAPVVRLLADDGNGRRGLSAPIRPTVVDDLQVLFTVTPELLAAPRVEGAFEVTVTNLGPVLSSNVTATVLLSPRYGGGPNVVLGSPVMSQGTAQVRTVLQPMLGTQVEIVGRFGDLPAGGVATMRFRASRSFGTPGLVTDPEWVESTVSLTSQPVELNQINNRASVSQELAQPCSDLGEGAVAWWRGAGDFLDALGAHPGAAVGSAALGEGRVGSAGFLLGGGDGVVRVPDAEALDFKAGEGFSIELWFRTTPEAGRSVGLFGKGLETEGSRGYGIGVEDGRVVVRLSDGERSDAIPVSTSVLRDVRDGQWHHLVVSADRGETPLLRVWVDGLGNGDSTPLTAVGDLSNEASLELGGRGGCVASWVGDLDEVVLRRTAVTAAEAQAGYRSGGHGHCTSVMEIQVTNPRFTFEAGQWTGLDAGVAGQPYHFDFTLRNRGPLAAPVRLFVYSGFDETNFTLVAPSGPVPVDPNLNAASVDLGSVAVHAELPMAVDLISSKPTSRWEVVAAGAEGSVRTASAAVTLSMASDADRDGMSDEYEQTSGLDQNAPGDAGSDNDFDGYTAAQEFEAGTKANDAASRLALVLEGSRASVQALASRVYRLERSSPLQAGGWEVIQTFRPEVDGPVSMELPPSDAPETYYRVVALLPY